jgi:hypothetical protein
MAQGLIRPAPRERLCNMEARLLRRAQEQKFFASF